MARLARIRANPSGTTSHAVFIHGLGGHEKTTWLSKVEPPAFWPEWLAEEFSHLAIWTVSYEAKISRYRGSSMHLVDRAENLLAVFLAEEVLQRGEITLIGHSLGGLVIKQMMRTAYDTAARDGRAATFLRNVNRIAFLGTPHFGSGHARTADLLRIFVWPSAATASLVRNDPNLRNLNNWYRGWAAERNIAHLVLAETKPLPALGLVVPPDSSDPGLKTRVIPVEADHFSICKPRSRDSEVYVLIRDFIARPVTNPMVSSSLESNDDLSFIASRHTEIKREVAGIKEMLEQQGKLLLPDAPRIIPTNLVDDAIRAEVAAMQRARFIAGYGANENALRLAERICSGALSAGSSETRARALAWCARIIDYSSSNGFPDELVTRAKRLANVPEVALAEARLSAAIGDLPGALALLASVPSPSARSLGYILVSKERGPAGAVEWASNSKVSFSDLDRDGRFFFLMHELELGRSASALEHVSQLAEEDFEDRPILLHAAAMTYLLQVTPSELRFLILNQLPFELRSFPLASDEEALKHRKEAQILFRRFAAAATSLRCADAALASDDYALWLELRDPASFQSSRERLESSLRNPTHSLRRVQFGFQFGISMDPQAIEAEISRRISLSGRSTFDIALARFSLAFTQKDPGLVAAYIDRHRQELETNLNPFAVGQVEVEMLVRAGQIEPAKDRFSQLVDSGLPAVDQERLKDFINGAGGDATSSSKARYEATGEIVDLFAVVRSCEEKRDWSSLANFSVLLFERTRALSDAERAAMALRNAKKIEDLRQFLDSHPDLVKQSHSLGLLNAWVMYIEGLLPQAHAALEVLRTQEDTHEKRELAINVAIASGNWEFLVPIIEAEWSARDSRTAANMLRAAQLGNMVGSPRVRSLVFAAVEKGFDDPAILSAAYFLASSAGWEDEEGVSHWLERGARLSGEDGPVQRVSLRDLLNRQPEWDQHEKDSWQKLQSGELPIFGAANLLRRSLIETFLLPAVANASEGDVRKRQVVPAFGGARKSSDLRNSNRIALEATSLLTFSLLDLLEDLACTFNELVVPHSTLAWLFEERHKIAFHQPSRIRDAHRLRQMLASGDLSEFRMTAKIDQDFSAAVGEELASLVAAAQHGAQSSDAQHVVVVSAPVHRVGSLMMEEADLSNFRDVVVGCLAVVDKLKEKGMLTVEEERRARIYLSSQGNDWPHQPEIKDNATLYLDDAVVSQLRHAGLLSKMRPAGLNVFVSSREIREATALIGYEQLGASVIRVLDRLRAWLAEGIQAGKIKVGRARVDEDEENRLHSHPTFSVIDLSEHVDAIASDDRFLNQHGFLKVGSRSTPIVTSLDVIDAMVDRDSLSSGAGMVARTDLRRSGYIFIPVGARELSHYVGQARVTEGRLLESAELRAVRENLLLSRMSGFLQLPGEAAWLGDTLSSIIGVLHEQWKESIDNDACVVRSAWLMSLLDTRGWAPAFGNASSFRFADSGWVSQLMQVVVAPNAMSVDVARRYREWVDDHVLAPMEEQDPRAYALVVQRVRDLISGLAAGSAQGQKNA